MLSFRVAFFNLICCFYLIHYLQFKLRASHVKKPVVHESCLQRGSDVPHSPVMYAYLIVKYDTAEFFVDASKVTPEVMDHLKKTGVELKPYGSIRLEIEK